MTVAAGHSGSPQSQLGGPVPHVTLSAPTLYIFLPNVGPAPLLSGPEQPPNIGSAPCVPPIPPHWSTQKYAPTLLAALCSCRVSPIPPHVVLISTQRTSVKTTNYMCTGAELTQKPFTQTHVYLDLILFLQVQLYNTSALNSVGYPEHCVNNVAFG